VEGGILPEEIAGARARAEEARQRALDFGAPGYFPPEWESADAFYQKALEGEGGEDPGFVLGRWREAAGAFEELFRNSLPLYARDREAEILEARDRALYAGAEGLLPEFLIQADRAALEALSRYEGGDYYPAAGSAALAQGLYRALETGTEALWVRLEIEERGLYPYAPEPFDRADEFGDGAVAAYRGNDSAGAGELAAEALGLYQGALAAALEALARERRDFAATERRVALELKANAAVREDFNAASALYDRGEGFFRAGDWPSSADLYQEAGLLFVRTQRDALLKRRKAEEAIKTAEERVGASEKTALNAELVLEGGAE
jgi:hypothetical protein